jgi:hypothetical protein
MDQGCPAGLESKMGQYSNLAEMSTLGEVSTLAEVNDFALKSVYRRCNPYGQ